VIKINKKHFFMGFIFSLVVYSIFPQIGIFGAGVIFLSSFLIDFDHYIYYVLKMRDFNLRKAYFWYMKRKKIVQKIQRNKLKNFYSGIDIFHGLEWVVIFSLLGFYVFNLFYFIALGMFFHLVLDWIHHRNMPIYPRKFSIIYDLAMV